MKRPSLAWCFVAALLAGCGKRPAFDLSDLAYRSPKDVDARIGTPYATDHLPVPPGQSPMDRRRYQYDVGKYLDVRFRNGQAVFIGGELPIETQSLAKALVAIGLEPTEADPPFFNDEIAWHGRIGRLRFKKLQCRTAPLTHDGDFTQFTAELE
jgi:hypothetical protein